MCDSGSGPIGGEDHDEQTAREGDDPDQHDLRLAICHICRSASTLRWILTQHRTVASRTAIELNNPTPRPGERDKVSLSDQYDIGARGEAHAAGPALLASPAANEIRDGHETLSVTLTRQLDTSALATWDELVRKVPGSDVAQLSAWRTCVEQQVSSLCTSSFAGCRLVVERW